MVYTNCKNIQLYINRLYLEAHSEPSQIFKILLFAKIDHYYLWKKLHLRCYTGLRIPLLLCKSFSYLKPFVPNAAFLYPLKTSENFTVFWCFPGVEKGCIGNKWFNHIRGAKIPFDLAIFWPTQWTTINS